MKHFGSKDFIILALFFILTLVMSSLFSFVDETPLETTLPGFYAPPMVVGFLMSIPTVPISIGIVNILRVVGVPVSSESHFALIPWLTAMIYSAILAFVLFKINARKAKKG